MQSFRIITVLVILTCLFCMSSPALSMIVMEGDDVSVELRGVIEAGGTVATQRHILESAPRLGLARLSGRAVYEGVGRLFLQYEAASGDARLLDALAVLNLTDWLSLRLGYFKTPVSMDYNVSAARKPFPARALITKLTPRRGGGGELFVTQSLSGIKTALYLGAFDPEFLKPGAGQNMMLTARLDLKWELGLGVHLGYADRLGSVSNNESPLPLYIEQSRIVDVAATFSANRWSAHAEAVIAPHRASPHKPAGLYFSIARKLGDIDSAPTLEPVVGYDYLAAELGNAEHRLRAGLNYYLLRYKVVPNLHYEMTVDEANRVGHAVFALLRMTL